MTVKRKSNPKIVKKAAKDLPKKKSTIAKPSAAPTALVKESEGRILNEQRNAPDPHKPPKKPTPRKR